MHFCSIHSLFKQLLLQLITTAKMGSISNVTEHDVLIESFEITDLRFPTSLDGVGSDAMHVGTNGSHPYIQLKTNRPGLVGEGIVSRAKFSMVDLLN